MKFLVILVFLLAEGFANPVDTSSSISTTLDPPRNKSLDFIRRKFLPSPDERLFPSSPFAELQPEDILLDHLQLHWEINFFKNYISYSLSDLLSESADLSSSANDLRSVLPSDSEIFTEIDRTLLTASKIPQIHLKNQNISESLNCENISIEISFNDEIEHQIVETLRDLQDFEEHLNIDVDFYEEKRDTWSKLQIEKLSKFVQSLKSLLNAIESYESSFEDFFANVHQVNLKMRIFKAQCQAEIDEKCLDIHEIIKPVISKIQEDFYFVIEIQFAAVGGNSLDVKNYLKGFVKSIDKHQEVEVIKVATTLEIDAWQLLDFVNGKIILNDDLNYCAKALIKRDDSIFYLIKDETIRMLEYLYIGVYPSGYISL